MSELSTRETVIAAARDLFARRGYTATTIKDIAAAAGCSPALVMKLTGSKAELFAAADPSATALEASAAEKPPPAEEPAGFQLVRLLVERRRNDEPEPWAMAPILVRESADPDKTRADVQARYLAAIALRIGDTSADRLRSQLVIAQLLGLAAAMRHLDLLDPGSIDPELLIRRYGALVQSIVDGEGVGAVDEPGRS
ncbi:TetR/AcrR family transcriptional regulator [Nocardia donostiensis]|uniref:TetR family transcriptional regulator n=1 Tax=Nocardia donostiensis TaxID=1538463 RepID=A0A1W0B103_9NOCA|nr:TetR/AcrR family transcriptional regulator [Nocardia donostiensis]ONM48451.1 TetR family transcriptional regulator [Nocardia donostiensis]OQS16160.1 TetR family transcriptional regulator [Nocardia donostiensis]OQS18598.1 TetR family transcriptional regulator [Nocardia donostiensis]